MIKAELDQMLESVVQSSSEISDVIFVTGRPVQMEVRGILKPCGQKPADEPLTSQRIEALANIVINNNPRLMQDLKENGSCDCGYSLKNACRFRVNVYFETGNHAMVMRYLKPQVPTFESLNLKPVFKEIIKETTGIIFVTGAAGVGKTTTIAAMLNEINRARDIHILTLEDPIEFLHTPVKATFSQRELGKDFFSFHTGMRAAMRQAPKIIFVGEIRDRVTMETVLNAGETGHLVLSTLHTTNASLTVNRIIGMFSPEDEKQVRERLGDSIRYVVSQRLVPASSGGRLLMTEVMGNSLRTREAIALGENENRRMEDIIEAGSVGGWHTFEQSLGAAYEQNLITRETAMTYCSSKGKMSRRLDALSHKRKDSFIDPL